MKTQYVTATGLLLAVILSSSCRTFAAAPVDFGSASDFTILAGSGITSIGGGTVQGDVGLSPTTGAAITGLTAPQVFGVIYTVDAAGPAGSVEDDLRLIAAKDDLTTAYNTTAGLPVDFRVATELGGTTKGPGVYDSASGTFGITGILTLDAGGDPGAVFIFKMLTTLTTAASSSVILINGALARNVFWQVGSSATLGATSGFKGIIMADQSITMGTDSVIEGSLLARVGMVTFDSQALIDPTPTLAMITAVRSRIEDGVAVISWDVALELDTAGYYLERWSDGLWQRVSADRIWPHLLVSGTRTYEQADPAAPLGTTQRYCIIELDNRGRLLPNGPYDLQLDGGEVSYDAWATGIAWNGAAADSASDPDGDGLTNFQEYLAGTDPLIPNSILRVNRAEAVAEGLQLTWGSTTGRVYAVEMTTSLIKPFVAIASGIAAKPPENNYVVPIDPGAASGVFFRVVVSQP